MMSLKNKIYFVLFILCLFSRLLTSIFYIEDIDSLRFALSIIDYDINKLQPHFPGYPIFCFLAKLIHFFMGNNGYTFSIIGGISIFIIIISIIKLTELKINSTSGLFLSFLVFYNPLLWIMSNRYMPDLLGLSVVLLSFYLLTNKDKSIKEYKLGLFFVGLLCGIRLSYLPLLLIPCSVYAINNYKKPLHIFYLIFGILIWLIPMVLIQGIEDLFYIGNRHTIGHFFEYGGTIFTDNSWSIRLYSLFITIWADGLGAYALGRHPVTMILSIFIVILLVFGIKSLKENPKLFERYKILLLSSLVYIVWILLFQNIIYKSRHIMPLIIIFIITMTEGQRYLFSKNYLRYNKYMIIFFINIIIVTTTLTIQHKNPSAIAQLKDEFIKSGTPNCIVSIPLVNYYLKTHGINALYVDALNNEEINDFKKIDNKGEVLIIGEFLELFKSNFEIKKSKEYYHNPYVNKMWSKLKTFLIIKYNE